MLTGKRFRLERASLAVDARHGKHEAVNIPAGAVIEVVSGPKGDGDRMVDVRWEGRTLIIFAVDVDVRGTEVQEDSAGA